MTITSFVPDWLPQPAAETAGAIRMALHILRRADYTYGGNVNPTTVNWDRCVFDEVYMPIAEAARQKIVAGSMTLQPATLWKWRVNPDGLDTARTVYTFVMGTNLWWGAVQAGRSKVRAYVQNVVTVHGYRYYMTAEGMIYYAQPPSFTAEPVLRGHHDYRDYIDDFPRMREVLTALGVQPIAKWKGAS